jgi:uncharacterized protein YceK
MARLRVAVILAIGTLATVSGCGTVQNLHGPDTYLYGGLTWEKNALVNIYLGQEDDGQTVFPHLFGDDSDETWSKVDRGLQVLVVGPILALDLPLTAIGDTLTAPYTFIVGPDR